MFSALDKLSGFDVELLRRNRFCIGVKRGGEYVCGGEVDDPEKVNKAVELLAETVRRIWRWRVWEAWWVDEAMDEWLIARDRLETQLRGKYSEEVINDITGLVDKFIGYSEQFLNYWREIGSEAKRLVDDLINGRTEVIIWEGEKGISVHRDYVTLEAGMHNGITVQLVLSDLEGVTIRVPDVFRKTMGRREYRKFIKRVLKALRGGLEEADGFVENGYAAMETTQTWQVVVWALLYPGENFIYANAVNVNEGSVTITYYMVSYHKPLKGKIFGNVDKLGEEELLAFMLGTVLGDGWADVVKPVMNGRVYDEAVVKITMASRRFNA